MARLADAHRVHVVTRRNILAGDPVLMSGLVQDVDVDVDRIVGFELADVLDCCWELNARPVEIGEDVAHYIIAVVVVGMSAVVEWRVEARDDTVFETFIVGILDVE